MGKVGYNKSKWLLSFQDGRYFVTNENTAKLAQCLKDNTNWDNAYKCFMIKNPVSLSFAEFQHIAQAKLSEYGLIKDANIKKIKKPYKYLRLKVQILSKKTAGKLGKIFSGLFVPGIFLPMFVIALGINIFNLIYFTLNFDITITISDSILSFFLLFVTTAFHEVGHISACTQFNVKHGGMGFGFYFIWPVAYSDVSAVWEISKKKRIIVNIAGIYLEYVYASILIILMLILQNNFLRLVSVVITINTFHQLNPFLRTDGYWILSDWLEIPNLTRKAWNTLMNSAKAIFNKKTKQEYNNKMLFLILYGLANFSIGFIFIFIIYISYTKAILSFPYNSINMITNIFNGRFIWTDLHLSYFIAFIFYCLFIRIVYRYIINKIVKRFVLYFSG